MRRQTQADRFLTAIHRNTANTALLERLPHLSLPDCWLVAGCLFQSVWNDAIGRPANESIKDYDIFYFDDVDLSYEAEDRVIRQVADACADLGLPIEMKNQARVHLWYGERFGPGYPSLADAKDGIKRFLVAGTCVGIGASPSNFGELFAPYGLNELFAGVLRPNPLNLPGNRFSEKAATYMARWPHLVIET